MAMRLVALHQPLPRISLITLWAAGIADLPSLPGRANLPVLRGLERARTPGRALGAGRVAHRTDQPSAGPRLRHHSDRESQCECGVSGGAGDSRRGGEHERRRQLLTTTPRSRATSPPSSLSCSRSRNGERRRRPVPPSDATASGGTIRAVGILPWGIAVRRSSKRRSFRPALFGLNQCPPNRGQLRKHLRDRARDQPTDRRARGIGCQTTTGTRVYLHNEPLNAL
jgi:hypothetical protein